MYWNGTVKQYNKKNTLYEILTPNGWEDFDSIFKNEKANKASKKIILENGMVITATNDHKFFVNGVETKTCDLVISMKIDTRYGSVRIKTLTDVFLEDTYEIYNATNHVIYANGIHSHQCDEFAFLKPKIADEFWNSILPSLSAGGANGSQIIITSTPNGSENKFAQIWFNAVSGRNTFKAIDIKNEEVPNRGEDFKKKMLETMSQDQYDQEFNGFFISSSGTLITSRFLESLRPINPISSNDSLDYFKRVNNRRLAIAVDVGTGVGSDFSVVQIFDLDTLEQVAEYRNNTLTTTEFSKRFIKILEELSVKGAGEMYYSIEANSIGQGVINLLRISTSKVLNTCENVIERKQAKHGGMLTTTKSKMKGCMKFKDLIEKEQMTIHSRNLLSELKFFVQSGASFKAETGMTDDLVMGCVVMVNMLAEIATYDGNVYDKMNSIKEFDLEHDEGNDQPLPFVF